MFHQLLVSTEIRTTIRPLKEAAAAIRGKLRGRGLVVSQRMHTDTDTGTVRRANIVRRARNTSIKTNTVVAAVAVSIRSIAAVTSVHHSFIFFSSFISIVCARDRGENPVDFNHYVSVLNSAYFR